MLNFGKNAKQQENVYIAIGYVYFRTTLETFECLLHIKIEPLHSM